VKKPITKTPAAAEPTMFFSMAALMLSYNKDGVVKQRTLNILIESAVPHILKQTLSEIQAGAVKRLCQENSVEPGDVFDIAILSIAPLANITKASFHAA
jgi:hypothetical protein